MGGGSSKNSYGKKYTNPYASTYKETPKQHDLQQNIYAQTQRQQPSKLVTAPQSVLDKVETKQHSQEEVVSPRQSSGYGSSDDEFYDGIPRFRKSSLQKSRSRRTRVSEMAAEVFDTLGNSMANLNPGSGASAKNNELSILAFEVANTIVKGSNIMQGLSRRSIRQLKEVIFPSEGVQNLVSTDMDELLKIVATDTRGELRIFAGEVVRFGNRCKDSQWHNLDRYFAKHSKDPQKQMQEEAESMMQQLMLLVQNTADLYQVLHTLDRLEQDYQHKRIEACISNANPRGINPSVLAADIKNQKKLVKNLKRKSLWSRSLEEVMGKLVDIVLFLNREITNVFGNEDDDTPDVKDMGSQQRLGPSGLALHYANIVLMIDSVVVRSSSVPPNTRETLYQSLPPSIKSPLRSKLHTFQVKDQLEVTEIKAEMEKTLQWLVPIATNTAKAHHGFGWVGEWGSTGSESNRQSVGSNDNIIQIETLHHADRQKTEAYILELLLWLNYLVSRSKTSSSVGNTRLSTESCRNPLLVQTDQQSTQKAALSPLPNTSIEV